MPSSSFPKINSHTKISTAKSDSPESAREISSQILSDDEADKLVMKLFDCITVDSRNRKVVNDVLKDVNVIERMILRSKEILQKESTLLEIPVPINICGDIHGQYVDLLRIFQQCGRPPYERYLFMGDYVDRGPNSLEVICLLLLLKVRFPAKIFLLRGNHECSFINQAYGFRDELEERFKNGELLWIKFQDLFNWLPFAARISKRILCMHGGLSPKMVNLDTLRHLKRPVDPIDDSVEVDLLWSDPDVKMSNGPNDPNFGPSLRGISHHFNQSAVLTACRKYKLDFIVRAHQVVQDGYEFFAGRHMITIFSAPNYCGTFNNCGAVLVIDEELRCAFITLTPSKHRLKVRESKRDEVDIDDAIDKESHKL
uniref:Serine/threonine-protein phosphatase n=1 Tax=Setaria digitata TaxID=48799 RepID=A0A915Q873_9BILA